MFSSALICAWRAGTSRGERHGCEKVVKTLPIFALW
jgi:hypothetical protein